MGSQPGNQPTLPTDTLHHQPQLTARQRIAHPLHRHGTTTQYISHHQALLNSRLADPHSWKLTHQQHHLVLRISRSADPHSLQQPRTHLPLLLLCLLHIAGSGSAHNNKMHNHTVNHQEPTKPCTIILKSNLLTRFQMTIKSVQFALCRRRFN